MIFSKEKLSDMEWRAKCLKVAEIALRWYGRTKDKTFLDHAKYFGQESKKLKDFIERGDYTERDGRRKRVDGAINFRL